MNCVNEINKPEFNIQDIERYIMSINIAIDGLSFVVLDETNIIHAKQYAWSTGELSKLKENLSKVVADNNILNKKFKNKIIFSNIDDIVLIPNNFSDKDIVETTLKNSLTQKIDNIEYTPVVSANCKAYYNINNELKSIVQTLFNTSRIYSSTAVFIEKELEEAGASSQLSLKILNKNFVAVGIRNKKLIAYNNFNYSNIDEFVFYLLSFVKQNKISLVTTKVKVNGSLLKSSLIAKNIDKYFSYVVYNEESQKSKEILFEELKKLTLIANN